MMRPFAFAIVGWKADGLFCQLIIMFCVIIKE